MAVLDGENHCLGATYSIVLMEELRCVQHPLRWSALYLEIMLVISIQLFRKAVGGTDLFKLHSERESSYSDLPR